MSLEDFPSLNANHVRMADKDAVCSTIHKILEDGPNSLQVVTDFDMTLTKQHVNGRKVLTSFGIFSRCKQLPESYVTESARLFKKYRPIEIDPKLPLETKIEAMNSWMIAAEELLRGLPFDPAEIPEVAAAYQGTLRDGTNELFQKLRDADIPILVFSAGLGDVVQAVLKLNGVLFENVKVISNFLKYEDGYLGGFTNEKLLHVFNKNEHAIEQDYFRTLKRRKNVLLMGDSIGDVGMIDGMEDTNAVLKIGFLYDQVEHSLPSYMEKFDIVLIDDQTMSVPTEMNSLAEPCNGPKREYESCFQAWFAERYLTGKDRSDGACVRQFEAYSACVKKAMKDQHIEVPDMEIPFLETEKEKR